MPPRMKLRNGIEKYALKLAYQELLPKEILERPKSGMRVPVHYWFQKELKRHARKLLRKRNVSEAGIFAPDRVRQLLRYDTQEGPGRYGLRLWMLITFETWRRHVFQRVKRTQAAPRACGPLGQARNPGIGDLPTIRNNFRRCQRMSMPRRLAGADSFVLAELKRGRSSHENDSQWMSAGTPSISEPNPTITRSAFCCVRSATTTRSSMPFLECRATRSSRSAS